MHWVELRVHGVSGTPPESLLATPHVVQVAGDDYSSFYRPVPEPDDHIVEGYHWGKFTSGSWRQAFTLLLVPFGLINATQFMLPRPVSALGKVLHAIAGAALRAIALVLTYLFTFAVSLILIDLVGWRWADKTRLLKNLDDDRVLQGCVVLSAVGVLLLGTMGLARGTREPPGDTDPTDPATGSDLGGSFFRVNPNAPTLRLLHIAAGLGMVAWLADLTRVAADPEQEGGFVRVLVVIALLAAAISVVLLGDPEDAVSVSWGPAQWVPTGWQWFVRYVLAPATIGLSAGVVIAELVLLGGVDREASTGNAPERIVDFDKVADGLMYFGVIAMASLYVAVVLHLWRGNEWQWSRSDAIARLIELVPIGGTAFVAMNEGPDQLFFPALTGLVIVVLVMLWPLYRTLFPQTTVRDDEYFFRPYAAGMAPFLLSAIAVFLAIGFSASAATAVSSTLKLDVERARAADVGTTPMLDRVAYAWGLTMAVILVLALGVLAYYLATRSGYRSKVDAMYQQPSGDVTALPDGWQGRVAKAMYVAQVKTFLPVFAIVFAGAGMLMSLVQAYESLGCDDGPTGLVRCGQAGWLDWISQPRSGTGSIVMITIGAWVFVAAAGLVVTVSRGALTSTGLRRGINVVWDVFSFWPHAVHPFVPRPYSRWTVVELRNRIRFHLGGSAGVEGDWKPVSTHPHVVVCAHSQGSLITFAAIMLLSPAERERIAFLSCGSQLRVIYPRAFPAYVNFDSVTWLFGALDDRWVNLYRVTDPLAGPVLSWKHSGDTATSTSRHFPLPPGDGPDGYPANEDRCRRCGNDWRLIDPVPYDADCETGAVYAIHGHHDYWRDPTWNRALTELRS